jgi:hypothetical protein
MILFERRSRRPCIWLGGSFVIVGWHGFCAFAGFAGRNRFQTAN